MSIAVAIGLTALTSLAVGLLLLPLLARRHRPQSREAYNLAVYRDQLAEIERDLARGLLTAEQAEAARAEIGRRILALDNAETLPEVSPKKTYVSVRRSKQFALIQPAASRVDVGINLKGTKPTARLETSGSFNAMVSHRVRLSKATELDAELIGWLKQAYHAA